MDGSKSGEAGVITWCNSIRFTMAQDPGRQFLHEQIQKEGFDFLDMYLESFLEGPKREFVEQTYQVSRCADVVAQTSDRTSQDSWPQEERPRQNSCSNCGFYEIESYHIFVF